MTTPQKGRIFISYRRADSAGYAGRIYDRLTEHFGEDAVFMDVDTIEAGLDFVEVLQNAVRSCDVLVALIGQRWLNIKDETGQRRLDNPEDFVRVEVAAALDRNIRVIPVLVDGTTMPRSTELPRNLKSLARRNALQVNHHSFNADAHRLILQLELALKAAEDSKILKAKAVKEARERAQRQAEIERLLKAADLAIDLQDWNLASEKLNDVLKLDANHLDARSKLDIVQRKKSELEQKREEVEKAAREKEKHEHIEREKKSRLNNEDHEKAGNEEYTRFAVRQIEKKEREEQEPRIAEEEVRETPVSITSIMHNWRTYGIGGVIILTLACLIFSGIMVYRTVFPEPIPTPSKMPSPTVTETPIPTPSKVPSPTVTETPISTPVVNCLEITRVNVRQEPSESSEILGWLDCNQSVVVIGIYNESNSRQWIRIPFVDAYGISYQAWVIANRVDIPLEIMDTLPNVNYDGATVTPTFTLTTSVTPSMTPTLTPSVTPLPLMLPSLTPSNTPTY